MTVEQKREIERELNWLSRDCGRTEIKGMFFTLEILGYCVFLTVDGYKIRKKEGDLRR